MHFEAFDIYISLGILYFPGECILHHLHLIGVKSVFLCADKGAYKFDKGIEVYLGRTQLKRHTFQLCLWIIQVEQEMYFKICPKKLSRLVECSTAVTRDGFKCGQANL
ncbi:hypothetical protein GOP47_0012970 [Adiantum capillus-veneris]|uniref:Uncharacterized protein n=1 Tax=Adiantum capillus-veneris TaxID=13818 RepID=A0A9D4ZEW6_ADICA|nr:hypothetical protein GOP47_0012970 [Adiantum capillus-veneris]